MSAEPQRARSAKAPSARYERQRARIIDAAVSLVNEKGVSGMTLQEVAQAIDLTTTSVTYYYRYKEQLAAAVFQDTLDRLLAMITEASRQATPRARVACYVELFFDQFALALSGKARPLAILSELRTLEEATRRPLIEHYQEVFRAVRRLFGDVVTEADKLRFSARAQMLNEGLFWAAMWLRRYPLRDLPNVRRRLFDILENGIAAPGMQWHFDVVDPDVGALVDVKRDFLCVASRLINDLGYKGASIDRIVGELNITKGSFYHHLEAKDDLIHACYREDYSRLARLQDIIDRAGGDVRCRLGRAVGSALALQFDGTHPLLRTTALQAMPTLVRQAALARFERNAFWLSGMLVDGMTEGNVRIIDPVIAGNIIISTINSAYDLRGWARRQTREQAIRIYGEVLLTGLFA